MAWVELHQMFKNLQNVENSLIQRNLLHFISFVYTTEQLRVLLRELAAAVAWWTRESNPQPSGQQSNTITTTLDNMDDMIANILLLLSRFLPTLCHKVTWFTSWNTITLIHIHIYDYEISFMFLLNFRPIVGIFVAFILSCKSWYQAHKHAVMSIHT